MPPTWVAPADAATPFAPTSANAITAANRTCLPTRAPTSLNLQHMPYPARSDRADPVAAPASDSLFMMCPFGLWGWCPV
jgi:hypothetical protein